MLDIRTRINKLLFRITTVFVLAFSHATIYGKCFKLNFGTVKSHPGFSLEAVSTVCEDLLFPQIAHQSSAVFHCIYSDLYNDRKIYTSMKEMLFVSFGL